jgi:hypothetical protein
MGILEEIVRKHFGEPRIVASSPFIEARWNDAVETLRCVLYKTCDPAQEHGRFSLLLRPIYGDAIGATLLRGALKVSMLQGPRVFGLYQIEELQDQPAVRYANARDPNITFFMDSANVWYYGVKEDQLYVYDAAMDELGSLGRIQTALEQLLIEWKRAKE